MGFLIVLILALSWQYTHISKKLDEVEEELEDIWLMNHKSIAEKEIRSMISNRAWAKFEDLPPINPSKQLDKEDYEFREL